MTLNAKNLLQRSDILSMIKVMETILMMMEIILLLDLKLN